MERSIQGWVGSRLKALEGQKEQPGAGLRQDRTPITSLIPIPGKTIGKDYGGSHRATRSGQIHQALSVALC